MLKKIRLVFFILLLVQTISLGSSDSSSVTYLSTIGNDFVYAIDDYSYIFKSFSRFDKNNLDNLIGIGAFTGVAMLSEQSIRKYINENKTISGTDFNSLMSKIAESQYSILLGGGIYLTGLFANSSEIRVSGRQIFETLLLAGVATTVLKSFFGRSRPFMNTGNNDYKFFKSNDHYLAMPSGHTTVAFSVASVLAQKIDRWWAYIGCYGIATLCGYSRMYLDRHWLSDVIIGAAVGTASGLAVCNAENKKSKTIGQIFIYPVPTGLGLCYIFR